ncbi:UNVERIFIED_CONTAM: Mitochondrial import inner membrane translocase subunit Tim9 [Sesamum calycinum]|uniref:Mitochondrial import inner membrane translocase subunit n=1 Tax=Sesamum calycinum TaxID=2727403 RepID=A0AAW2PQZ6_9LAMI
MDKSMLGDLDALPEADKQRMSAMIDQLQIRDRTNPGTDLKDMLHLGFSSWSANPEAAAVEKPKLRLDVLFALVAFSLRMYNSLVERCFTDCVDTFRRKTLDKQEETCVRRCAEKFLKHSMRVGMRFAELNQGAATQD